MTDEQARLITIPVSMVCLTFTTLIGLGCAAKGSENFVQRAELQQVGQALAVRDQALAMIAGEIKKLQLQVAALKRGRNDRHKK